MLFIPIVLWGSTQEQQSYPWIQRDFWSGVRCFAMQHVPCYLSFWCTIGVSVEIPTKTLCVGSVRAKLILVLSLVEPNYVALQSNSETASEHIPPQVKIKLLMFHSKQEMENHRGRTESRRNCTLSNRRRTLSRCQAGAFRDCMRYTLCCQLSNQEFLT